jgi:hypothetical protein
MTSRGPDAQSPRRRWFQWRLRTLLILMTCWAVLLALWRVYLEPIRRSQIAIERLAKLQVPLTTEPAGPPWLRRLLGEDHLQHIVAADFSARSLQTTFRGDPSKRFAELDMALLERLPYLRKLDASYLRLHTTTLHSLARLKQIEFLSLNGVELVDSDAPQDELMRLATSLPELRRLSLCGLPISDASIDRLIPLRQLARLDLAGTEVSFAGAERLADARPDLALDVDIPGLLWSNAVERYLSGSMSVAGCAGRVRRAIEWKRACASFKTAPGARLAALTRLDARIGALKGEIERRGQGSYGKRHGDVALIACLCEMVRVELASARKDRLELDRAGRRALDSATSLRQSVLTEYFRDPQSTGPTATMTLLALETAHELEIVVAKTRGDTDAEHQALVQYRDDIGRIADDVQRRADAQLPGGSQQQIQVAACWQIDVDLRLARTEGNSHRQRAVLRDSPERTLRLRLATLAAYEQGVQTSDVLIASYEKALALDLARARLEGDSEAEERCRVEHGRFLAQRIRRYYAGCNMGGDGSDLYLPACALLNYQLERGGSEFYHRPGAIGDWEFGLLPICEESEAESRPPDLGR